MRSIATLAIAVTCLSFIGCRKVLDGLNPTNSFESMRKQDSTSVSTDYVDTAPTEYQRSSSSSSSAAKAEIIDIPSAFAQQFTDKQSGYDQSQVYVSADGDVQFLKIHTAIRLHKHLMRSHVYSMISGQGQVTLNGQTQNIRAGQVIVVPPGTTHKLMNTGEQPLLAIELTMPTSSAADVLWLE